MPKSVKPRTALTFGVEIRALTMGYVIWSSMRSGLRPIHSVDTITWTSEISGTASSGVRVMAQMPHTVRITVPVNTRNRLAAHQSMIRSIMAIAPSLDARPGLLRGECQFLLADFFYAVFHAHRHVPLPRHHGFARFP